MKKKCKGCNTLRDIDDFQQFKTCEICRKRQQEVRQTEEDKVRKINYYNENKNEVKAYGLKYRRTPIGRFKKAGSAAKYNNVIFNMTFDQYVDLISNPCFYCNGFFKQVTAGSGLDRIVPDKGYIIDNCVSCCETCNRIKNSNFSPEETTAAVKAIIKIRKKNNV